ncbi:MAG TPA: bifunctional UDP-3-O-[3-hydroxymyristoyl] N-acetylglucosamine deacetylase/3-hydroxyacyl-ACP dehydratase [candidate division Zixibacteria bacterium]|nr:bifunctional UDP-3-O-[3-hydroxymyristoyl] N-acetylglucosamine deacetylase/3-hydroxyacyl-ACP dehydratase [candidate division Zixibacteria bacterium]
MRKFQSTIEREVSIEGIGLHTGKPVRLTFRPAPPNTWAVFVREDIGPEARILASIDNATGEHVRGTTLANSEGHRVTTVEHVLAACAGLQIDNIEIALSAEEPPVLDGSARPFADKLIEAGIVQQDVERQYFVVGEIIQYHDVARATDIHVVPFDGYRVTFMVDYRNPALGTQYTTLVDLEEEFLEEFSSARTFCFLSEVEHLLKDGLIKGGNPENALVIIDKEFTDEDDKFLRENFDVDPSVQLKVEGNPLLAGIEQRFYNEPVRHKVLDLLGDMHLLGFPLKGFVLGARSGHSANIELVKLIKKQKEKLEIAGQYGPTKKRAILDASGIMKILPHRYPFLMVDEVVDFEKGKWAITRKNVTANEPFFQGHFPGHPIMPGVLLIEGIAQTGAFLMMDAYDDPEEHVTYFLGVDKVRFRKGVTPGDTVTFRVEMRSFKRGLCKFAGKGFVDGEVVCEGEFMAMAMER